MHRRLLGRFVEGVRDGLVEGHRAPFAKRALDLLGSENLSCGLLVASEFSLVVRADDGACCLGDRTGGPEETGGTSGPPFAGGESRHTLEHAWKELADAQLPEHRQRLDEASVRAFEVARSAGDVSERVRGINDPSLVAERSGDLEPLAEVLATAIELTPCGGDHSE